MGVMEDTVGMHRMKDQFLKEGTEKDPQNSCCSVGLAKYLPHRQGRRVCLVNESAGMTLWFRHTSGDSPTPNSVLAPS